ncbi:MAG: cation transporter [Proteobacteria bacterium]|nr:cation transporter [Pseudomonadota bacterium]
MNYAQNSVILNAALSAIKIIAGLLGNSYALVADGIESASDIFSSLIVWAGLALSNREANDFYHFGYGKAESIAAAAASFLLIVAGLGIGIESYQHIVTPHQLPKAYTLFVIAIVIVIKEIFYRKAKRLNEKINSAAVSTDAWHQRADAITSVAAFIGISIALIGGIGWECADDYAALICAFVIIYNGASLFKSSLTELMDKAPTQEIVKKIEDAAYKVEGVLFVEQILARKSGLGYFVDMHVHADPEMSLQQAHILSGKVKKSIIDSIPHVQRVLIHMEPVENH